MINKLTMVFAIIVLLALSWGVPTAYKFYSDYEQFKLVYAALSKQDTITITSLSDKLAASQKQTADIQTKYDALDKRLKRILGTDDDKPTPKKQKRASTPKYVEPEYQDENAIHPFYRW